MPSVDGAPSSVRRRRELVLALPGLLAVAMGVVLAVFDGGFPPTVWYPAALFTLVLLTVSFVAASPALPRDRLILVGLAAYGLFVAWSFLGIAWADSPGDAWMASNRSLFYGLVLLLVATRPWRIASATAAVAIAGLGVGAIAIGVLLIGALGDDPTDLFLGGRLSHPAGYLNATANLWLIGYFPAVHLFAAGRIAWPVRVLALPVATVLLEMELLSQSRGAAIALGVTAVVYIAMTTSRWPALLTIATTVGLTALSFDVLTDVRDSVGRSGLASNFDDAIEAVALSALAALVLGLAVMAIALATRSTLERHRDRRLRVARWGDRALVLLALAAVVAGAVAIGAPKPWLDARWDDFKNSGYTRADNGETRFSGGLGSNRYDFYRVSLDQFEEHPIRGVGGDNFAAAYLRERRTLEAPRYPHSLAFRVLSQHGLVGTLLFVVFLVALVAASVRSRIRATREGAALVAGALAAFVAFFVHALGDWLWSFPALGVLAFALLAVAAGLRGDGDLETELGAGLRGALAGRTALAALVLAAAVGLAIPGIAARYTAAAYDDFRTDPNGALDRLDRAADLNPLSDEPLVAKGVILQRLGRPRAAIAPLEEAISRQGNNWFSRLELALARARIGQMARAATGLREAKRLNPLQPLLADTLRDLRAGERIDPIAVERELFGGLRERLRATDPDAGSTD
jgi:tetratricopeptide (TPR) repeat protein